MVRKHFKTVVMAFGMSILLSMTAMAGMVPVSEVSSNTEGPAGNPVYAAPADHATGPAKWIRKDLKYMAGRWEGNTFVNTWADYKISVPDGYSHELEGFMDFFMTDYDAIVDFYVESSDGKVAAAVTFYDLEEYSDYLEAELLMDFLKEFLPATGFYTLRSDAGFVQMGGYDYGKLEVLLLEVVNQDIYLRNVNGSIMMMQFVYLQEDAQRVSDILGTMASVN